MQQKRDPSEIVQEVSAAPAGRTPPYFFSQNTPKEGGELGDSDSTIHTHQQSLASSSFTQSKHGIWDRYLARGPNSQDDFADGAGSSCGAVCEDTAPHELWRKVHTRNPSLGKATRTRWSTFPPTNRASRFNVAKPPLFVVQHLPILSISPTLRLLTRLLGRPSSRSSTPASG